MRQEDIVSKLNKYIDVLKKKKATMERALLALHQLAAPQVHFEVQQKLIKEFQEEVLNVAIQIKDQTSHILNLVKFLSSFFKTPINTTTAPFNSFSHLRPIMPTSQPSPNNAVIKIPQKTEQRDILRNCLRDNTFVLNHLKTSIKKKYIEKIANTTSNVRFDGLVLNTISDYLI